jgi:hypothetical protein
MVGPEKLSSLSDGADVSGRCMSDGERALRIALADSMAKHYDAEWQQSSNFADLGRAHWHELRKQALEGSRG